MMQELLGGSNVGIIGGGERSKGFFDGQSPSPSSSAAAAAAAAAAAESLRCPRCDSPNTKFCYYNNYNLTQPRHFCKTCRRYWTKGGALRNVPIGGGCRKNKSATIAAAVAKSGVAGKLKSLSSEIGRSAGGLFGGGGFDHHEQAAALSTNPTLWAPSQNSHILSLLRANQNLNNYPSTHLTNSVKEDGLLFGSSMNARTLGFDPVDPTHLPYMGLSNSSYRSQTDQPSTNQGFGHGNSADQNSNNGLLFQELYQKFRPTTTNYYPDQNGPIILGHVASATCSMNSAILESAPVSAGELGFWNNNNNNNNNNATLSWATDFPTSL